MGKKITISLSESSINRAIRQLENYQKTIKKKTDEICRRLADYGLVLAQSSFDSASFDYVGPVENHVTVESTSNGYRIIASGRTVLLFEFGAGITYGKGHPKPMGFGPGTYPGQTHALTGEGWYLPKAVLGRTGVHTYGNPPSMAMYNASQEIRDEVERIAREVFASD